MKPPSFVCKCKVCATVLTTTNGDGCRLLVEVVHALLEVGLGLFLAHEDEHFPDRVVDRRRRLVQLLLCDPQIEPLLFECCLSAVCLLQQTRAFNHTALHLCGLCGSKFDSLYGNIKRKGPQSVSQTLIPCILVSVLVSRSRCFSVSNSVNQSKIKKKEEKEKRGKKESFVPFFLKYLFFKKRNAERGDRTPDHAVKSRALYRLS